MGQAMPSGSPNCMLGLHRRSTGPGRVQTKSSPPWLPNKSAPLGHFHMMFCYNWGLRVFSLVPEKLNHSPTRCVVTNATKLRSSVGWEKMHIFMGAPEPQLLFPSTEPPPALPVLWPLNTSILLFKSSDLGGVHYNAMFCNMHTHMAFFKKDKGVGNTAIEKPHIAFKCGSFGTSTHASKYEANQEKNG